MYIFAVRYYMNTFIKLIVPPRIVCMDEHIVVHEGSSIAITCEVDGYPQPRVLFQRFSTGINEDKRIKLIRPVIIPINLGNITRVRYILNITEVLRKDHGEYECYARNSIGESTKSVVLDVQCK